MVVKLIMSLLSSGSKCTRGNKKARMNTCAPGDLKTNNNK